MLRFSAARTWVKLCASLLPGSWDLERVFHALAEPKRGCFTSPVLAFQHATSGAPGRGVKAFQSFSCFVLLAVSVEHGSAWARKEGTASSRHLCPDGSRAPGDFAGTAGGYFLLQQPPVPRRVVWWTPSRPGLGCSADASRRPGAGTLRRQRGVSFGSPCGRGANSFPSRDWRPPRWPCERLAAAGGLAATRCPWPGRRARRCAGVAPVSPGSCGRRAPHQRLGGPARGFGGLRPPGDGASPRLFTGYVNRHPGGISATRRALRTFVGVAAPAARGKVPGARRRAPPH